MRDYRGFLRGKVDETCQISTQGDRLNIACFDGKLGAEIDLIYNKTRHRTEVHFYVTSGPEFEREFKSLGAFYLDENKKVKTC